MQVSEYASCIEQGGLDLIRCPITQAQGHSCRLQIDHSVGRRVASGYADRLPHVPDRRDRAVE
jgi:hypothetical protein